MSMKVNQIHMSALFSVVRSRTTTHRSRCGRCGLACGAGACLPLCSVACATTCLLYQEMRRVLRPLPLRSATSTSPESSGVPLLLCRARQCLRRTLACALGTPRPQGVFIDAYGTLIHLAEPIEAVYLRSAERAGVRGLTSDAVKQGLLRAFSVPLQPGELRYRGDAREFWRNVVTHATGSDSPELFEALFSHYAKPEAWRVADGAHSSLKRLRASGLRLACVSNFDTRLRCSLTDLQLAPLFDVLSISAEVGAEKPDRRIFEHAAHALGLPLSACWHVGDHVTNDLEGATAAGCGVALLWGRDVHSFTALADRFA